MKPSALTLSVSVRYFTVQQLGGDSDHGNQTGKMLNSPSSPLRSTMYQQTHKSIASTSSAVDM